MATAKPRARRSRTVSKYFSIHSLRPGRMHTVPRRPAGGNQRANRSETPSGVLSVPVTMHSGTGFAGIETSFTGSGGLRGSVFPSSDICVCIAPSYSSRQP